MLVKWTNLFLDIFNLNVIYINESTDWLIPVSSTILKFQLSVSYIRADYVTVISHLHQYLYLIMTKIQANSNADR